MKREIILYLNDIIQSITYIENFTENITKQFFCQNVEKQSAVTRQLEIIGEAVKNLPLPFTKEHQSIPWKDIAGLRDIMIHSYHRVDYEKVWNVVKNDLPLLKEEILLYLKDIFKK